MSIKYIRPTISMKCGFAKVFIRMHWADASLEYLSSNIRQLKKDGSVRIANSKITKSA